MSPVKNHVLRQWVALLTLSCFVLTQLQGTAFSAGIPEPQSSSLPAAVFPDDLTSLKVPANIGKLEEVFQGSGPRLVILLQDAHSVPNAQRNIRNLIDFFQQTHGLEAVAVEGARGRLDPQIFRSFPDRELLKGVFSEYLENGELTGTTLAAIFNKKEAVYEEIEDWDLYEEGYGYYLAALQKQNEISARLKVENEALEIRKKESYSPELLAIDSALSDFRNHTANLLEILELLASIQAPPAGSELALMLEENAKTVMSQIPLEMEVKSIAEKMRKHFQANPAIGKSSTVSEFNEKYQAFQTSSMSPEQFAVFLKDVADDLNLPVIFSGDFKSRVKKQKKIEDIEGTRFFDQFERYSESVKEHLFKGPEDREIDKESQRLHLLERLRDLEVSRDQWHQLKSYARRGTFEGPNNIFLDQSDLDRLIPEEDLRSLFEAHLRFYENAEMRDGVFTKNLEGILARPAKPEKASGARKAVMLVAGGFHTEGVLSQLRQKGISYVLLMPQIESLPETLHYQDHMRGNVSWKDYFETEGGEVNVYKAFVRAARDHLKAASEKQNVQTPRTAILKDWRDQVIRDLSEQGRIADSAQYTRFMDEAAGESPASFGSSQLLQKAELFVAGLKELHSQGQLTERNILGLLRPAALAAPVLANQLVPKPVNISARPGLRSTDETLARRRAVPAIPTSLPKPTQAPAAVSVTELILDEGNADLRIEQSPESGARRSELRTEGADSDWASLLGGAAWLELKLVNQSQAKALIEAFPEDNEKRGLLVKLLNQLELEELKAMVKLAEFPGLIRDAGQSEIFLKYLNQITSTDLRRYALNPNLFNILRQNLGVFAMMNLEKTKDLSYFKRLGHELRVLWIRAAGWLRSLREKAVTAWKVLLKSGGADPRLLAAQVFELQSFQKRFTEVHTAAKAQQSTRSERSFYQRIFFLETRAFPDMAAGANAAQKVSEIQIQQILQALRRYFPEIFLQFSQQLSSDPKSILKLFTGAETPSETPSALKRLSQIPEEGRQALGLTDVFFLGQLSLKDLNRLIRLLDVTKDGKPRALMNFSQPVIRWMLTENDETVKKYLKNLEGLAGGRPMEVFLPYSLRSSEDLARFITGLSDSETSRIGLLGNALSAAQQSHFFEMMIALLQSSEAASVDKTGVLSLTPEDFLRWQDHLPEFSRLQELVKTFQSLSFGEAGIELALEMLKKRDLSTVTALSEFGEHELSRPEWSFVKDFLSDPQVRYRQKADMSSSFVEWLLVQKNIPYEISRPVQEKLGELFGQFLRGEMGSKTKKGWDTLRDQAAKEIQDAKRSLLTEIVRASPEEILDYLERQGRLTEPSESIQQTHGSAMDTALREGKFLEYLFEAGLIKGAASAEALKSDAVLARAASFGAKFGAITPEMIDHPGISVLVSLYYSVGGENFDFNEKRAFQARVRQLLRRVSVNGLESARNFEKIQSTHAFETNKKVIEQLVGEGYDAEIWKDGIEVTGVVKNKLSKAEQDAQRGTYSRQILGIIKRMGLLTPEFADKQLLSPREAEEFLEANILTEAALGTAEQFLAEDLMREEKSNPRDAKRRAGEIVEGYRNALFDILRYFHDFEARLSEVRKDRSEVVRIVIRKDPLEEVRAGLCNGSGCFNPYTGVHREMPFLHATEANSVFAIAYNSDGEAISTVVLAFAKEGVVVFGEYNGSGLSLDALWSELWKKLAAKSPRIFLTATSPGRALLEQQKALDEQGAKDFKSAQVTKQVTVWKDLYFDFGEVKENGDTVFQLQEPSVVTAASAASEESKRATQAFQSEFESSKKASAEAAKPKEKAPGETDAARFKKALSEAFRQEGPDGWSLNPMPLVGKLGKLAESKGLTPFIERSEDVRAAVASVFSEDLPEHEKMLDLLVRVAQGIARSELRSEENPVVKAMTEIKGKILSTGELESFKKLFSSKAAGKGGLEPGPSGYYLYYDKSRFTTSSAEQAEKYLRLLRYLTEKGIFYPGTLWGVYQTGSEYKVFAVSPRAAAVPKGGSGVPSEDLENAEPMLTRPPKMEDGDWYDRIFEADSHILKWYHRIEPAFDVFKEAGGVSEHSLAHMLNFAEASHWDNWGWAEDGKLYPIDIEIIDLNTEGYEKNIDAWIAESDAQRSELRSLDEKNAPLLSRRAFLTKAAVGVTAAAIAGAAAYKIFFSKTVNSEQQRILNEAFEILKSHEATRAFLDKLGADKLEFSFSVEDLTHDAEVSGNRIVINRRYFESTKDPKDYAVLILHEGTHYIREKEGRWARNDLLTEEIETRQETVDGFKAIFGEKAEEVLNLDFEIQQALKAREGRLRNALMPLLITDSPALAANVPQGVAMGDLYFLLRQFVNREVQSRRAYPIILSAVSAGVGAEKGIRVTYRPENENRTEAVIIGLDGRILWRGAGPARSELRNEDNPEKAKLPSSQVQVPQGATFFADKTVREVLQDAKKNLTNYRAMLGFSAVLGTALFLMPALGYSLVALFVVMMPVHEFGHYVFAKYFYEKRFGKAGTDQKIEDNRPGLALVGRWVRGVIPQPSIIFEENQYKSREQAVISIAGFGAELIVGGAALAAVFFLQPAGWIAALLGAVITLAFVLTSIRLVLEAFSPNGDTSKFIKALKGQLPSIDSPTQAQPPSSQPAEAPELKEGNQASSESPDRSELRIPEPLSPGPEIPESMTFLVHGTNLTRKDWDGKYRDLWEKDTLVIRRSLSVVTREEMKESQRIYGARSSTASSYSIPVKRDDLSQEEYAERNKTVQIRILFFKNYFNYRDLKDAFLPLFPENRREEIMELIKKYFFANIQHGRHPLVPDKTELIKVGHTQEDGVEVLWYVPEQIKDLYDQQLNPRSELRASGSIQEFQDEKSRLFPILEETVRRLIRTSSEGGDKNTVNLSDIQTALEEAHVSHPEFRQFSLHHQDLDYEFADYLKARQHALDPELDKDLQMIHSIVWNVSSEMGDRIAAREDIARLDWEGEHQVLNVTVHRLAAMMETSDSETISRIEYFLEEYMNHQIDELGLPVADFTRYLIAEHLEKGNTLVFLGRGTEQVQQTLEGLLGGRLKDYQAQIIEVLASSELIRNNSPAELLNYLRTSKVPQDQKVVFVDTGFYGRVAKPLVSALNTAGGDSEFCLFCYVKPSPGLIQRVRALLSYFFPQGKPLGIGYNEVSSIYAQNENAFSAAAHFFDDLLGKRYESVWQIQEGKPVLTPTRTPKFYALTSRVMNRWITNQIALQARTDELPEGRAELRAEPAPQSIEEGTFFQALKQSPLLGDLFEMPVIKAGGENVFTIHLDGKARAELVFGVEPQDRNVSNLTLKNGHIFWDRGAERPVNPEILELELLRVSLEYLKSLGYKTAQFVFQFGRGAEFLTEKFPDYLAENNPALDFDQYRVDAVDSDFTLRLQEINFAYPRQFAAASEQAAGESRQELRDLSIPAEQLQKLAENAGVNWVRFYRDSKGLNPDLGQSVASVVMQGASADFDAFLQAFTASVQSSLGEGAGNYIRQITAVMADIAGSLKTRYPDKRGTFALSPSADRQKLDRSTTLSIKDALTRAEPFINAIYYHGFLDNEILQNALKAGSAHIQPVSSLSRIRTTDDVPFIPLLTEDSQHREVTSQTPFMQIGILYPEAYQRTDASQYEETFAVFMQFVFGYVAQNELKQEQLQFLNQLQAAGEALKGRGEAVTPEAVLSAYAESSGRQKAEVIRELNDIKAALIRPLGEILEEAPQLLGGLELGSPAILVGEIVNFIEAYQQVKQSA